MNQKVKNFFRETIFFRAPISQLESLTAIFYALLPISKRHKQQIKPKRNEANQPELDSRS